MSDGLPDGRWECDVAVSSTSSKVSKFSETIEGDDGHSLHSGHHTYHQSPARGNGAKEGGVGVADAGDSTRQVCTLVQSRRKNDQRCGTERCQSKLSNNRKVLMQSISQIFVTRPNHTSKFINKSRNTPGKQDKELLGNRQKQTRASYIVASISKNKD